MWLESETQLPPAEAEGADAHLTRHEVRNGDGHGARHASVAAARPAGGVGWRGCGGAVEVSSGSQPKGEL